MVDDKTAQAYLSRHGVKKTQFRIELIELFLNHDNGLSHQDIQELSTSRPDKVTIYRALDSFLQKGLIHKVPDANNISKYALCPPDCSEGAHEHNHVHFICNSCEKTFCLDELDVPAVRNPKGFQVHTSNLTLEGVCAACCVM